MKKGAKAPQSSTAARKARASGAPTPAGAAPAAAAPQEPVDDSTPGTPGTTDPQPAAPEVDRTAASQATSMLRSMAGSGSTSAPASTRSEGDSTSTVEAWSPDAVARPATAPQRPAAATNDASQGDGPAALVERPAHGPKRQRDWAAERRDREQRRARGELPARGGQRRAFGAAEFQGVRGEQDAASELETLRRRQQQLEGQLKQQDAAQLARAGEQLGVFMEKLMLWGGRFMARRKGVHWQVEEQDARELGKAWGEGMAPYMGALAEHSTLAFAALGTFALVQERLEQDERLQATGQRPVMPPTAPAGNGAS